GAFGRDANGRYIVIQIIGDRGVKADHDAQLRQALAEPLAVGVEVLTAGEFAADGKDLGFHCLSSVIRVCSAGFSLFDGLKPALRTFTKSLDRQGQPETSPNAVGAAADGQFAAKQPGPAAGQGEAESYAAGRYVGLRSAAKRSKDRSAFTAIDP